MDITPFIFCFTDFRVHIVPMLKRVLNVSILFVH